MKKILLVLALTFLSITANAVLIDGVEFGDGQVKFVTDVYFNTDVPSNGELITQGVGQVLSIQDSTGEIWNSASSSVEFNFLFDDIVLDATFGGAIPTFANILGNVDFYSNALSVFAPTGIFSVDSAAIQSGTSLLSLVGHGVAPNNWTVVGSSTGTAISGNGQLDLINGAAFDVIVQDQYVLSDQSLADLSFNFGGDRLLTFGYDWSGSADFATVTTNAIPEPNVATLFGLGMIGMIGASLSTRRRKM